MGCNCKKDKVLREDRMPPLDKANTGGKIANYGVRVVMFLLLSILAVPVTIPVVIYTLFKSVVLNKNIDFFPAIVQLTKPILGRKKNNGVNEDVDIDELNPEDYVPINVETVK